MKYISLMKYISNFFFILGLRFPSLLYYLNCILFQYFYIMLYIEAKNLTCCTVGICGVNVFT